jgi:hypothetical protein
MNPDTFYSNIAGASGKTVINAQALILTGCMGFAMLLLDRRYAVIPFLIVTLFITTAQRIVVASLDFDMVRIMVLFGWTRVLLRREQRSLRLNKIDTMLLAFVVSSMAAYTLLYRTSTALIYKLGFGFNALGMYFLFRILLRDVDDLRRVIVALAYLAVPIMLSMIYEQLTQRNLFSVFGGVPAITQMREGKLRAQAPFAHPILAGSFGAGLFPLFAGLYGQGARYRFAALLGAFASVVIVMASSSSGPVMGLMAGIFAAGLWLARGTLHDLQLLVIALLVLLQLFMKVPVYALIARIDIVGGSTGYQRYALIDEFVRHFRQWVLLGVKTTDSWGYNLYDVTNQYIAVGVDGGLLTLVLFVILIGRLFGTVGKSSLSPLYAAGSKEARLLYWSLGASLFSHCVSFIGVSYFDQIIVIWYLLLAMIGCIELRKADAPAALAEARGVP